MERQAAFHAAESVVPKKTKMPFCFERKNRDQAVPELADNVPLCEKNRSTVMIPCSAGWLNIKSNVVEDSSVAIDLYRLRGLIEQGFDQLKNQLPGRRLRVTEASHLGKLLVYLIGCDLRLQIRHNLMLQQERGPNWKMELPGNSINKLLMSMDRYTVRRNRSCEYWLVDLLPKRVRDWLTCLFRVDVPAKRFRS